MPLDVTGIEELIESCLRFPVESRRACVEALDDVGRTVTKEAKSQHRFKRKSGNLQRSMRYETKGAGAPIMTLRIYLDSRITTTRTKAGKQYSYGLIQHDGTGRNYKKSWASPEFTPSNNFDGLKHDHFLTDAFDRNLDESKKHVADAIDKIRRREF